MKKALLYILLLILLFSNTYFNEVFKLPSLITHFIEHNAADSSIDIVEFLSMHYGGDDRNDNDQDKDMRLPFKKIDGQSCIQIAIPTAKTIIERQISYTLEVSKPVPQDVNLSNPALAALFRPPRY